MPRSLPNLGRLVVFNNNFILVSINKSSKVLNIFFPRIYVLEVIKLTGI